MNDYETRRQEKIKKNQKLLADLDIKPVIPKQSRNTDTKPPTKKRRLFQEPTAPSRTSARIASTPARPNYNEDETSKPIRLPGSAPKKSTTKAIQDPEPQIPVKDIEEIRSGWTNWKPVAPPPTRDGNQTFHFEDFPTFTPNKSPEEMLREGCFGGSYYRPLRSRKLGITISEDWRGLPPSWISGLNVDIYLTNPIYNPSINKFHVSCGQSIEEWEAAGWISHEHDVRGWFQWYTRFWQGRRCEDDERQVGRWRKCVGETGRWRRMLLKKYGQMGVREVWDDGVEEEGKEVSPVMHQTCHHWGFEVRQDHLDEFWEGGGK